MTTGEGGRSGRGGLASTMSELLASGGRSYSFEFFPPATDEGERTLWEAIRRLEPLGPTFVSVTYGAGGSTRGRPQRIWGHQATETTLAAAGELPVRGGHA